MSTQKVVCFLNHFTNNRRFVIVIYLLLAILLYQLIIVRNQQVLGHHLLRMTGEPALLVTQPKVLPKVRNRQYGISIYIRSAPHEFVMRQALRDTWLREARLYGMIGHFVLARTNVPSDLKLIDEESERHKDLILLDSFIDHYHHLSLKTKAVLDWHVRNVEAYQDENQPVILVWANLDGFIYPKQLIDLIDEEGIDQVSGTIYGFCTCSGACDRFHGPAPYRQKNNRWHMPENVWPYKRYPHYCMGYALVMSPGCASPLLDQALKWSEEKLKTFWIDDVLFTGVFRVWAKLKLKNRLDAFPTKPDKRGHRNCTTCVGMHSWSQPNAIQNQWLIYLNETGSINDDNL